METRRRWWQFWLRWLFVATLVAAAYGAGRARTRQEIQAQGLAFDMERQQLYADKQQLKEEIRRMADRSAIMADQLGYYLDLIESQNLTGSK